MKRPKKYDLIRYKINNRIYTVRLFYHNGSNKPSTALLLKNCEVVKRW